MRTFIAIPLPQECRRLLQKMQDALRASNAEIRWTSISSIHLTLKFLGEIEEPLLPQLTQALREVAPSHLPFQLSLYSLGCFPNLHGPRVVWCGITGALQELANLQADVERACNLLGFAPEERPFRPHLTLGRVQGKRNLHRLVDYIKIGSDLECKFAVNRFEIYKSTLTPHGALYDVLATIEL